MSKSNDKIVVQQRWIVPVKPKSRENESVTSKPEVLGGRGRGYGKVARSTGEGAWFCPKLSGNQNNAGLV